MQTEHQYALIQEQERVLNTISILVHDHLGQPLSMVRAHLYRIMKLSSIDQQQTSIRLASDLCEHLIADAKHIGYLLNSSYVKAQELKTLLDHELERLHKHYQIPGKLICNEKPTRFNENVQLIIFRIAQEALHNVAKHSGASYVTILVEENSEEFRLQILDNGVGFSPDYSGSISGLGLHNMRSRAKLVNGELDISSMPPNGSTVTLTLKNPDKFKSHGYDVI